jgi:hypothetical protein
LVDIPGCHIENNFASVLCIKCAIFVRLALGYCCFFNQNFVVFTMTAIGRFTYITLYPGWLFSCFRLLVRLLVLWRPPESSLRCMCMVNKLSPLVLCSYIWQFCRRGLCIIYYRSDRLVIFVCFYVYIKLRSFTLYV